MNDLPSPFEPIDSDSVDRQPDTDTELVERAEAPPRIWTALTVAVGGIAIGTIVAIITFAIAMFTIGGADPTAPSSIRIDEILATIIDHPVGLWVLILPGQLTFLATALFAAFLSPIPIVQRLRLVKGRLPVWTWPIVALATPAVGFVSVLMMQSMSRELSPHLKMIEELLTSQTGLGLLNTAFLIAVVPAITEEYLFRGYLQSRLLERWSPTTAILTSSAIFAGAHLDPMHSLGVFPLGVWLGIVAWRAGSIWPAVLCHFVNNLVGVIASQFGSSSAEVTTTDYLMTIPCLLAMIVSIRFLLRSDSSENSPSIPSNPKEELRLSGKHQHSDQEQK